MAFVQGKRPCFVVPAHLHKNFRNILIRAGYTPHNGPRTTRPNEICAWIIPIGFGRQVHVQEELRTNGDVAVFAHTEPEGYGLRHFVSAVRDKASFQGGSRKLRNDVRDGCKELKWTFAHFGPVRSSAMSSRTRCSVATKKSQGKRGVS